MDKNKEPPSSAIELFEKTVLTKGLIIVHPAPCLRGKRPEKRNRCENNMLPTSIESWTLIFVACLAGFTVGRLIKAQRKKAVKRDEYLDSFKRAVLAEARIQTKKERKKKRRANKQSQLQNSQRCHSRDASGRENEV
ncbi:MAG: hypothetical protein M0P74_08225 [Syntrophales bacterium]|jgi:hypothetical protein|nr:hypothetical protein [Syntrophales bacterium]